VWRRRHEFYATYHTECYPHGYSDCGAHIETDDCADGCSNDGTYFKADGNSNDGTYHKPDRGADGYTVGCSSWCL
jgi:hypothetical protein